MPEARNRGSSPDAQFLVVSRQLGSRSGQPAPGAAGNGLDVLVLAIDGCRAGAQRTPLCSGKLLQGPVGTGGRVHSPVQEEPSPRSQETSGGRADTENLRSQARPVLLSACPAPPRATDQRGNRGASSARTQARRRRAHSDPL